MGPVQAPLTPIPVMTGIKVIDSACIRTHVCWRYRESNLHLAELRVWFIDIEADTMQVQDNTLYQIILVTVCLLCLFGGAGVQSHYW